MYLSLEDEYTLATATISHQIYEQTPKIIGDGFSLTLNPQICQVSEKKKTRKT